MLFSIRFIFVSFCESAVCADWGHEARLRVAVRVNCAPPISISPAMAETA